MRLLTLAVGFVLDPLAAILLLAPVATGPLIDPGASPSKSAAMRKRSGSHSGLERSLR